MTDKPRVFQKILSIIVSHISVGTVTFAVINNRLCPATNYLAHRSARK